jgi:hypothetical protein
MSSYLLNSHHNLNSVQTVQSKVLGEVGGTGNLSESIPYPRNLLSMDIRTLVSSVICAAAVSASARTG